MKRHYPEQPVVGVGAVIFQGDAVLLVRRGKEPARGQWTLPGGAVEVGETLQEALLRELAEETGLAVEVVGVSAVLERIFRDEAGAVTYHYILVDYLCRWLSGEPQAASDITAACFVPPAQLLHYHLVAHTAAVITRAREQLRTGAALPLL